MRLLVLLFALPLAAGAAAPDSDGFIWIDANTRIKVKPVGAATGAATGATAPKAPEKQEKKEEPKK
jgi:hypothetical protein